MENELTNSQPAELDAQKSIENPKLILVSVRDTRDPAQMNFDLDGFVNDLGEMRRMFMTDKSLYRIGDRIRERFQKYAGVGFSESDNFLMALQQAKAIEVVATSGKKISKLGRTIIDVNIITEETEGYRFTFEYDQAGQYYKANWESVDLYNAISDHSNVEPQSFQHNDMEPQSLPADEK